MWFRFSLPQYYLCLKIKLSLTIKDWFANFTKIRKKCSAKLSKWIANRVSRTVNSNPARIKTEDHNWNKIWRIKYCYYIWNNVATKLAFLYEKKIKLSASPWPCCYSCFRFQDVAVRSCSTKQVSTKFTVKLLCQNIYFFKQNCSSPGCNLLKKRLRLRCFPVKFVKFLRPPIL